MRRGFSGGRAGFRRRSGQRPPVRLAGLLLVVLSLLAGCVSVPTSGPVEPVAGQQPACQDCINVDVAPPMAGEAPKEIVQGFLRATSNFQPNYAVARQFLTDTASETWQPDAGVSIYSGSLSSSGKSVVLDGRLVGVLDTDRAYSPRDEPWRFDFDLVKEAGEWRINHPPQGLMVAEFAFDSFYRSSNLYFVGSAGSLVPSPIFLPSLRSPESTASVLIRSLLRGPSQWLAPAVTSAFPAGTELSVDSVTITDGIASVPLSPNILELNEAQRKLLAAQILYTLQATGIRGVIITVNQQPFQVPGADRDTGLVTLDARYEELDPVPPGVLDALYVARGRKVQLSEPFGDTAELHRVAGPLGAGRWQVSKLAVAAAGDRVAVVTRRAAAGGGRDTLRVLTSNSGTVSTVVSGADHLLRPDLTRLDELWAIGRKDGRQRLWVQRAGRLEPVDSTVLHAGRVVAFSISPDGARMALIRRLGGRTQLGLMRIVRGEKIQLTGWRPLDVDRSTTPDLNELVDLDWLDATDLAVLGGASPTGPLGVYRISQDGNTVAAAGEQITWDAVAIAVSLKSQTPIVLDSRGQVWRDGSARWVSLLAGVEAIAAPG